MGAGSLEVVPDRAEQQYFAHSSKRAPPWLTTWGAERDCRSLWSKRVSYG